MSFFFIIIRQNLNIRNLYSLELEVCYSVYFIIFHKHPNKYFFFSGNWSAHGYLCCRRFRAATWAASLSDVWFLDGFRTSKICSTMSRIKFKCKARSDQIINFKCKFCYSSLIKSKFCYSSFIKCNFCYSSLIKCNFCYS